ncbi:MAG: hypothetical protein J6B04_00540 [Clostridia bacterium]|nr:hypothetical protein [Clostridia bacterium]
MAKKKPDDLDTETTFANMNVDGFRWYNPNRDKGLKKGERITRKEYWAMVRGAFAAMLPIFIGLIAIGIFIYFLVWLWIGI